MVRLIAVKGRERANHMPRALVILVSKTISNHPQSARAAKFNFASLDSFLAFERSSCSSTCSW